MAMKEAKRHIIDEIIDGRVKTRKDLQKIKLEACRDYQLDKFPSNASILQEATNEEKKNDFFTPQEKAHPNHLRGGSGGGDVPPSPVPPWKMLLLS